MAYEHLRLEREAPINPRHPRRFGGGFTPPDPRAHGARLGQKLQAAKTRLSDPAQADIGGFDNRKLLKIRLHAGDKSVPAFDAIPGVEIVSQEDEAVVLAYSPEVRTTRLDYRRAKLWFNLVVAAKLDEVTQAFQRNREEGMGEHGNGRWLPNDTRKNGTLQVSRWAFRQAPAGRDKVFVVVTRQDSAWSQNEHRAEEEPYALAVVLADRDQANAQLYAQVQAMLQARAQARARARIGGRG